MMWVFYCLPCGHLYGLSCIKKWLLQSSSSGKCPRCNTVCAYKDVVLLYVSRLCVAAHQKTSSTRYFPFTEQGFIEFKEHEWSRHLDAYKKYNDVYKRRVDVVEQQRDLVQQMAASKPQWEDLLARVVEMNQRAEKLGQQVGEQEGADAFKRQYRTLRRLNRALDKKYKALEPRADALKRRTNVLAQRCKAYEPNLKFFSEMYKEHLAQHKNNEPCSAAPSSNKH
ncbi:zinc finger, RING/FYVE/PHD-type [Artemisia annua]|uniref:Zinc finger, RING/FYVE/PHD-type n=1 Tax=Artemisia annua TaxID=35608 RepID=A0A2U1P7B6_ARTAN|nr:zinc finger, RING/FYVE/PHD-type [Artemisia annua]